MNDWQVGDRVVCVNDDEDAFAVPGINWQAGFGGLRKGRVYTIRSVHLHHILDTVCIRLKEIERPLADGDPFEIGYNISRFRKVQPRKADISVFTKMLNEVMA